MIKKNKDFLPSLFLFLKVGPMPEFKPWHWASIDLLSKERRSF